MRKTLGVVLGIILTLAVVSSVLAAWTANIIVQETAGTSYAMFPARVPLNTTALVAGNYIDANGRDTLVVGAPHMLANDKLLFACALPALSSQSLAFTTDNTPLADMAIIPGYGGVITNADAALEPGQDFTFSMHGYIDTLLAGLERKILYKRGAFVTYISAPGTILSGIITGETTTTVNLVPDGAGDYTNIANAVPAVAHYINVADAVDATVVHTQSVPEQKDAYTLQNSTIPAGRTINSVTVYYRIEDANGGGGGTGEARPYVRLNGLETTGAWQAAPAAWQTYSEALLRPGGGDWSTDDLNNLQVAIGLKVTDALDWAYLTQTYIAIQYVSGYTYGVSTTINPVPSGTGTLVTDADPGTNRFTLTWTPDSGAPVTNWQPLGIASVVPSGTIWYLMNNDINPYSNHVPYLSSNGAVLPLVPFAYEHVVGVNTIVRYLPNNIIAGDVLPDLVVPAQNGTIIWGTNPTGVSATIGNLEAIGTGADVSGELILPSVAGEHSESSSMFPSEDTLIGSGITWLYPTMNTVATLTNTPIGLLWWWLIGVELILTIGALFFYTRNTVLTGIGGLAVVGANVSVGLIPGWFLIIIGLIVISLAVQEWNKA